MNRFHIIPITITILLAVPFACSMADIMPDPLTAGKALQQRGEEITDVRMVAEDVMVRVFECEIITVAEFSMYNEGETETMEVGFPYLYQGNFIEFRAYVDGEEIDVREGRQENVGRKKSTILWKVWEMTFEKEEACEVRVEYRTKVFEYAHTFLWTDRYVMPQAEIDEAQRLTKTGSVSYYLDTGKAWKGVLDHCRVEFELVGRTDANIESAWPEGGRFTGKGMVWEYSDYEPTSRVVFQYYPNMAVESVPGFLLEVLNKYPKDPHLASSVASKLGSTFDNREMSSQVYHSFLADWDGQIPQLMEYASGGRCRFNYKGAGGDFYTIWRMASILFKAYESQGTIEMAEDIAPNVSSISGAIADSLDTCGNLSESNARLFSDAINLRDKAEGLLNIEK